MANFNRVNVNGSDVYVEDASARSMIAVAYDSTKTYGVGSHVIYNDSLYQCNAETTGTFDSKKWTKIVLADEINSLNKSLAKLYPVGSIYLSVNDTDPGTFIGGTWELVGSGKTLWGADASHAAGTTIDAGLPNMTGWIQFSAGGYGADNSKLGGAFYADGYYADGTNGYVGGSGNGTLYQGLHIDASRSNAIYGNSSTVQPPAYVVYMWKRTA